MSGRGAGAGRRIGRFHGVLLRRESEQGVDYIVGKIEGDQYFP